MTYITVRQKCEPKQLQWEDVLFEAVTAEDLKPTHFDTTGTITRKFDELDKKYLDK